MVTRGANRRAQCMTTIKQKNAYNDMYSLFMIDITLFIICITLLMMMGIILYIYIFSYTYNELL